MKHVPTILAALLLTPLATLRGALCSPTRAALMTGRHQQRCDHVADEELSPIFRAQRRPNPVQRWAWGTSTGKLTLPAVGQIAEGLRGRKMKRKPTKWVAGRSETPAAG